MIREREDKLKPYVEKIFRFLSKLKKQERLRIIWRLESKINIKS